MSAPRLTRNKVVEENEMMQKPEGIRGVGKELSDMLGEMKSSREECSHARRSVEKQRVLREEV